MSRLIVGRHAHAACLSESGCIQLTIPRSLSGSFIAITIYGDNKFNLLSNSLPVAANAASYVDTSYNYNDAQVSMGKAAVHCTSAQSLHCETRNKVF